MKVVILAGGYGTRISEETTVKPKPMVTIGGKPILWHIMRLYSHYGHNDFIICLGYKGDVIRDYFNNLSLYTSDVTFDYSQGGKMKTHRDWSHPWKVSLIETGKDTMTGGRVKRIQQYIEDDTFLLTYGDGVANIDINKTIAHHSAHNATVTVSAVRPQPRFGALDIDDNNTVLDFKEKNKMEAAWINGGFMVASKDIFNYLSGDKDILERDPMLAMVHDKKVSAYMHDGYWQPMDTIRERQELEAIWASGEAPWKVWQDDE